ncbi:MAG: DUF2059 domain-containing protein [Pseudomonadota bacterium]
MRAGLALAFGLVVVAGAAAADPVDRLLDAMQIDEVVNILVDEGSATALGLEERMFPGRGGAAWEDEVERIYERDAREAALAADMRKRLEGEDLAPLLAFLESDVGQRVMALEVSARRAFVDPEMEEIALSLFADAEEEEPVLHGQVMEFVEVNDLVDQNVEGAFRANAAFALGAHEAGAFPGMSLDALVAQLWGGDEAVEADVSSWLYAYLMTAYRPLPEEDLAAYIDLSRTPSGQLLNDVLMTSFGTLFTDISFDLGSAAGRFMAQQEL